MGLIGYIAKRLFLATALFLLVVFIPGLPPENVTFTAYKIKPSLPLTGKLGLNGKLNNAERLFENKLKGPEGLAIYKNELYTGIHGGHIVKIINDNKYVPVIKFGKACEHVWEEGKCGRVLGLTFDKKGALYAADAYYGLFKANITTGSYDRIVAIDEIIDGKPVKVPNSVDVANDGTIYWSVSSTSHYLYDGVYTLLADGNGRLIKTDLKKKTHEVLIDNIQFANGVVLSQDESFVLVAETAQARVLRYYLKGSKKGTFDVFIDALPGLPDNLKRDTKGGFYIPLIKPLDVNTPHIPSLLAPYPLIRTFITRVFTAVELLLLKANDIYPSDYLQRATHYIGHFESVEIVSGKRVTIIRTDVQGNIVETLHATDGSVTDICDIEYYKGAYYLASPFSPYLGRVKLS